MQLQVASALISGSARECPSGKVLFKWEWKIIIFKRKMHSKFYLRIYRKIYTNQAFNNVKNKSTFAKLNIWKYKADWIIKKKTFYLYH